VRADGLAAGGASDSTSRSPARKEWRQSLASTTAVGSCWLIVIAPSSLSEFALSANSRLSRVFEADLASALVLALFIPLIISSGGNSGAQASTLVIRAMATGDVKLRDCLRVFRRELLLGFALGGVLAVIGFLRIALWPNRATLYTDHYALVAMVVGLSLMGVVTFGSLAGAMLPFGLRKLKLDPATCSAPFVATLVDVSGLIIYFSLAQIILRGTLL
jgi:magnesium transporter